jgi:hypothetical protein
MSKPRSDNVLMKLPEEQQCKLAEWLLNGMPYHEANVLVEKEFGVTLRSLSAYSGFWREVCEPALLARRKRMVSSAEARAEEVDRRPGQFDKATLDAISERAYALAISPQSAAKDVKAVMMLLLKAQDQSRKERELGLAMDKFQFDAAKACLAVLPELKVISQDKGLSEPEKVQQIRLKLFGVVAE